MLGSRHTQQGSNSKAPQASACDRDGGQQQGGARQHGVVSNLKPDCVAAYCSDPKALLGANEYKGPKEPVGERHFQRKSIEQADFEAVNYIDVERIRHGTRFFPSSML